MEEIVGSEAIKSEVLDDARKKAARILEEAEEESAKAVAAIEAAAAVAVEGVVRENEAKAARYRMETMARFPLERTRMRAVFVEAALRDAARGYMAALPPERVAALAEAMLRRGASFLEGKEIELRRSGLSEQAARSIAERALPRAASLRPVEEPALPAPGLVAAAVDGSVELRATMDLVEASLLDAHRGELAQALCGEALGIEALVAEAARP